MATQTLDTPLTKRQERFVLEYLLDPNGTQAVIRAGYARRGAEVQATRLLKNAKVRAELDAKRRRLAVKAEITQGEIAEVLRREMAVVGRGSQAVAAAMGLAKLGGLIVERVDSRNLHKILLAMEEEEKDGEAKEVRE